MASILAQRAFAGLAFVYCVIDAQELWLFVAFVHLFRCSLWFGNARDLGSGSRKHWSSSWFSWSGLCNIVFCITPM